MSNSSSEKQGFADATKIGDCAAQQPLSGVDVVMTANNGHASFVHMNNSEPKRGETSPANSRA